MRTEIDTIKITMTLQEAKDFGEQMNGIFQHFASAVNSIGATSEEQLMLDYPEVSKFCEMLRIFQQSSKDDLPW